MLAEYRTMADAPGFRFCALGHHEEDARQSASGAGGRGQIAMEQMAAVESDLVDLAGVSLEALLSIDGTVLAEPLADLLQSIDDPQVSASGVGPRAPSPQTVGGPAAAGTAGGH